MRYLQGIITWIDSLESGRQFRSWAATLVKILGVVVSVGISVWSIAICVDTSGRHIRRFLRYTHENMGHW